jgi:hypothetical protein
MTVGRRVSRANIRERTPASRGKEIIISFPSATSTCQRSIERPRIPMKTIPVANTFLHVTATSRESPIEIPSTETYRRDTRLSDVSLATSFENPGSLDAQSAETRNEGSDGSASSWRRAKAESRFASSR